MDQRPQAARTLALPDADVPYDALPTAAAKLERLRVVLRGAIKDSDLRLPENYL